MSAGTQISMNPNLLTSRNYQLDGGGQFQARLTASPGVADAYVISQANAQCTVDFQDRSSIRVNPSNVKAYRFLPYREGNNGAACTYTELDANAQLVLTGPLSGCFIYVAKLGARTILFHCNANGIVNPGLNAQAKIAKIDAVINQHFNGAATVARLVWDANGPGLPGGVNYTDYNGYLSFVVGCKPRAGISLKMRSWTGSTGADDWTFYVFGYNANGRILRAM
jgi:hypothetical protein